MKDNLRVTIAIMGLREIAGPRVGTVIDDLGLPTTVNLNAYTVKDVQRDVALALRSAVEAKQRMGERYHRVTLTVVVE